MIAGLLLILLGISFVWDATARRITGFCAAPRWVLPSGLAMILLGLLVLAWPARAAAPKAGSVPVVVPEASAMYRHWVEQAVAEEWGVSGSPARLAAQLHQESSWNPRAHSPVGAEGLAQFMPSTARWMAEAFPDRLGSFDPWDPRQAALAAAVFDAWLVKRNPGIDTCSTWAFALSAYNGGETALRREQRAADRAGRSPRLWFDNVARYRARSPSAWRENRGYVSRILTVLEPAYIAAGWAGQAACA